MTSQMPNRIRGKAHRFGFPRRVKLLGGLVLLVAILGGATAVNAAAGDSHRTNSLAVHATHPLIKLWKPASHGGAVTTAAVASPLCTAADLTTQFWTTTPAMNVDMSGFNVINESNSPCSLPEYPQSVNFTNSDGALVSLPSLPNSQGQLSDTDFADFGSAGAWPDITMTPIPANPSALTLMPNGVASDLLITTSPVNEPSSTSCISTPTGGSITVSLGADDSVTVTPQADALITASPEDPTASPSRHAMW